MELTHHRSQKKSLHTIITPPFIKRFGMMKMKMMMRIPNNGVFVVAVALFAAAAAAGSMNGMVTAAAAAGSMDGMAVTATTEQRRRVLKESKNTPPSPPPISRKVMKSSKKNPPTPMPVTPPTPMPVPPPTPAPTTSPTTAPTTPAPTSPPTPAPSSSFKPTETIKPSATFEPSITSEPTTTIPPYLLPAGSVVCPGNDFFDYCNCGSECFDDYLKALYCNCAAGKQCCAEATQSPTNAPTVTSEPTTTIPPYPAGRVVCPGNDDFFDYCNCGSECFDDDSKALYCNCAAGKQCCAEASQSPTNAPTVTSEPTTTIPPYPAGRVVCPGNDDFFDYCNCGSDCFDDDSKAFYCNCAAGKQCCAEATQSPTNAPTVTSEPTTTIPPTDEDDYFFPPTDEDD